MLSDIYIWCNYSDTYSAPLYLHVSPDIFQCPCGIVCIPVYIYTLYTRVYIITENGPGPVPLPSPSWYCTGHIHTAEYFQTPSRSWQIYFLTDAVHLLTASLEHCYLLCMYRSLPELNNMDIFIPGLRYQILFTVKFTVIAISTGPMGTGIKGQLLCQIMVYETIIPPPSIITGDVIEGKNRTLTILCSLYAVPQDTEEHLFLWVLRQYTPEINNFFHLVTLSLHLILTRHWYSQYAYSLNLYHQLY